MKKYQVTGMTCAACSARVESAAKKTAGVESCSVSLLTNSMTVEGNYDEKILLANIKKAGYGASADGKDWELVVESDDLKQDLTTKTFTFDEEPGAANVLKNGDILGVMFKDSEGNLSQLVYASDMTTTVDDVYVVSGLSDNTWGGSGGAGFTYATGGNFTAVPEPTSGLLLLLGMAGLALKRKRA